MKLVHAGQKVTGNYLDPRGPEHNGRFGGDVVGDLLMLTWIKPGDWAAAVMSQRGKAYLRIKDRGQRLEGRWGYDESNDDGGPGELRNPQPSSRQPQRLCSVNPAHPMVSLTSEARLIEVSKC